MKLRRYRLTVTGLDTAPGTMSFAKLIQTLRLLEESSQKALRFAIEGTSSKVGPLPKWVQASSEFVFRGTKRGSTIVEFDAPQLGATAEEQIRQDGLWYKKPEPTDTALSILAKSVSSIEKGELESEDYDKAMLDTLMGFKQLLEQKTSVVKLIDARDSTTMFSINENAFQKMQKIQASFPAPQPIIVSGELDMLEKSTRKFKLRVEDGHVLYGRAPEGAVSLQEMKSMFGAKVTVRGIMHFTANGKPRLLEADLIRGYEEGDLLFEQLKATADLKTQMYRAKEKNRNGDIVSDIWGKWPGDESIEELLELIRDKS